MDEISRKKKRLGIYENYVLTLLEHLRWNRKRIVVLMKELQSGQTDRGDLNEKLAAIEMNIRERQLALAMYRRKRMKVIHSLYRSRIV
jgi:hypothetical protein